MDETSFEVGPPNPDGTAGPGPGDPEFLSNGDRLALDEVQFLMESASIHISNFDHPSVNQYLDLKREISEAVERFFENKDSLSLILLSLVNSFKFINTLAYKVLKNQADVWRSMDEVNAKVSAEDPEKIIPRLEALDTRVSLLRRSESQTIAQEKKLVSRLDAKIQDESQTLRKLWDNDQNMFTSRVNQRIEATQRANSNLLKRFDKLQSDTDAKILALECVIENLSNQLEVQSASLKEY